jgi:hypothetical protein
VSSKSSTFCLEIEECLDVVGMAGDAVHAVGVVQRLARQVGHLRVAEERGTPVEPFEPAHPRLDELLLVDRRVVLLEQLRRGAAPAAGPVEERGLGVVEDRARPPSGDCHPERPLPLGNQR